MEEPDNAFSINKVIGTIITAVFIWLGVSVHNMTVQMAGMSKSLEHHSTTMSKWEEKLTTLDNRWTTKFENFTGRYDTRITSIEQGLHAVQVEQGKRTGKIFNVDELDRRLSRVEERMPID